MNDSKKDRALSAFAALGHIPDDYVLAAEQQLFEAEAGIRRPERPRGRFDRFLSSGWGVAMISGIVALTVLLLIIRAGVNAPTTYDPPVPPVGSTIGMSDRGASFTIATEQEVYPVGTNRFTVILTGKTPGEPITVGCAWHLERLTEDGAVVEQIAFTEEVTISATPPKGVCATVEKTLYGTYTGGGFPAGTYRLHATEYNGEAYVSVAWCEFTVGEAEGETEAETDVRLELADTYTLPDLVSLLYDAAIYPEEGGEEAETQAPGDPTPPAQLPRVPEGVEGEEIILALTAQSDNAFREGSVYLRIYPSARGMALVIVTPVPDSRSSVSLLFVLDVPYATMDDLMAQREHVTGTVIRRVCFIDVVEYFHLQGAFYALSQPSEPAEDTVEATYAALHTDGSVQTEFAGGADAIKKVERVFERILSMYGITVHNSLPPTTEPSPQEGLASMLDSYTGETYKALYTLSGETFGRIIASSDSPEDAVRVCTRHFTDERYPQAINKVVECRVIYESDILYGIHIVWEVTNHGKYDGRFEENVISFKKDVADITVRNVIYGDTESYRIHTRREEEIRQILLYLFHHEAVGENMLEYEASSDERSYKALIYACSVCLIDGSETAQYKLLLYTVTLDKSTGEVTFGEPAELETLYR